jgi:hypothetical protein
MGKRLGQSLSRRLFYRNGLIGAKRGGNRGSLSIDDIQSSDAIVWLDRFLKVQR